MKDLLEHRISRALIVWADSRVDFGKVGHVFVLEFPELSLILFLLQELLLGFFDTLEPYVVCRDGLSCFLSILELSLSAWM